jgi:polysaccharide biosynthesis/export protein
MIRLSIFSKTFFVTVVSSLLLATISCTSAKKLVYFPDLPYKTQLPDLQPSVPVIQPDDILDIKISSAINTEAGLKLNTTALNYLVDADGNLEFPLIGKVKVNGLTIDSARKKITNAAAIYVLKPVVIMRYINFRFTVLGEVKAPQTYAVSNEKVSILEALGYAGDLTQYAQRKEVRIIRDSSGKREVGIINLNEQTVFTSPYYYLKRNDVIYVQPAKQKSNADNLARVSSIVATISGILALALTVTSLK